MAERYEIRAVFEVPDPKTLLRHARRGHREAPVKNAFEVRPSELE